MGALVKDKTMVNDVLNSDIPPFDLLSEEELAVLTQSLSIVYFEAGEDIIPAGGSPEGIYIIIKGQVENTTNPSQVIAMRSALLNTPKATYLDPWLF
jgi:signal-transduction protein with cAMP-binding, CBS, and nucleotidyltransferase domain